MSPEHTNATLNALADRLETGDEFTVFAGEFIVDDVIDCDARPMVHARKKSVGGYMDRTYRLEWADPTDEDDETLVIKTKYKSHWSEWSTFAPEKVDLARPVLVTDGGEPHTPEDYPGTGDLPDRLAFVKPDRARVWIDLHDRDDVLTAATLADGQDVSTATVYRMLEELAENVSTYRDGRATTGPENGQNIRSELQPEYESEIHHARLYANLDKLVDRGLVEKGEIDGRTNSYELTPEGRRVLAERREWQAECVEEVDA